jgi:hypothetical protein
MVTGDSGNADHQKMICQILLNEIGEKHKANHEYDKMIWAIRSGFLAIFGAGWGIILKAFFDAGSINVILGNQAWYHNILLSMLLISCSLGIGGFILDQSYIRRKFRVVYTLDMIHSSFLNNELQTLPASPEIAGFLQICGDKNNTDYARVSGYFPERAAAVIIYFFPLAIVAVCVALLW